MGRMSGKKSRASNKLRAGNRRKKAKIERIKELIRRIELLMSRSTGTRYFTYKLKRHQAADLYIQLIEEKISSHRYVDLRTT